MDDQVIPTHLEQYLTQLIALKEDDLTRDILKPLFQSMGYERVDFNGGPYEKGKDLIAVKQLPPRKKPHVCYIQTKKIGMKQNSESWNAFSQILYQLRHCIHDKITDIYGNEYQCDEVYFICPEQASSRFLENVISQLGKDADRVAFLDGPEILKLIGKYKPDLLNLLSTFELKISSKSNIELVNQDLLNALKTQENKPLKKYYCDLSFFVGSIESNHLLHSDITIKNSKVIVDDEEWQHYTAERRAILETSKLDVFQDSPELIVKIYGEKRKEYLGNENQNKIRDLKRAKAAKINLNISVNHTILQIRESAARLLSNGKISKDVSDRILSLIEESEYEIENIEAPRSVRILFEKLVSQEIKSRELIDKITRLEATISRNPNLNFTFNLWGIEEFISSSKKEYLNKVERINKREVNSRELEEFLISVRMDLKVLNTLTFSGGFLSKHIELRPVGGKLDRISVSPHDIFHTGLDIAVYGGAGVGKTTTLQVYATDMEKHRNKLTLYIPLNKLATKIISKLRDGLEREELRKDLIYKLILLRYDQPATEENIIECKKVLSRKPSTLILDGLDEIYNVLPELIHSINEFKLESTSTQIIISSRDCVQYLDKIKFLGITLLPFTKIQLVNFIKGWCSSQHLANTLIEEIDRKELYQHIKTPLLATITCSLAERGVKVPSNENQIYLQRLNLLSGRYDEFKDIERQTLESEELKLIARTCAFKMHMSNTRTIDKAKLLSLVQKELKGRYSGDFISTAINELIDPCNIIIVDKLTGSVSFGHFRFQEHLAALELQLNRGISLTKFLSNEWWRGALSLFAQDNDILSLFEEAYQENLDYELISSTLDQMIKNAPKNSRHTLRDFKKHYSKTKYLDDIVSYYNDNDEYEYNY